MTLKFNIKFYGIMFFGFLSVTQWTVSSAADQSVQPRTAEYQRYDWYQVSDRATLKTSSSGNLNPHSAQAIQTAVILSRNQSIGYNVQGGPSERQEIYYQAELNN